MSTTTQPSAATGAPAATRPQVDPRGQQFAAAVTAVVLAVVLLAAPSPVATALLAVQALLFAIGAGLGVQSTPHALVFRALLRPRLGPPRELEDAAPPRFAQAVGLSSPPSASSASSPARPPSAWSPPASRWSPPCSTRSSASAWAASSTS